MKRSMTDFPPLPSNFVVYDPDNPSPYFSPEKIAYIESIKDDFSDEEVKQIRRMERFTFNLNMGGGGADEIPGIRKHPVEQHLYFKRFSPASWRADVKTLMARIPDEFADRRRCLMPCAERRSRTAIGTIP